MGLDTFVPSFSLHFGHLSILTHQPALPRHTTATKCEGYHVIPRRYVKPITSLQTAAHAASWGCITHSEVTAVSPLPHTVQELTDAYDWIVSLSLTV